MKGWWRAGLGAAGIAAVLLSGCTGGQEGTAAVEEMPKRHVDEASVQSSGANPRAVLESISPSIPLYGDAQFRPDLTSRDAVVLRNQYGNQAEVYTLATDDSFPQVYHYYTTYLAQYRAYQAPDPLPAEAQRWRTLEVQLDAAMQDPFIPGSHLPPSGRRVLLQIAETEAEPKTVIRYIIVPALPAQVAALGSQVEAEPDGR